VGQRRRVWDAAAIGVNPRAREKAEEKERMAGLWPTGFLFLHFEDLSLAVNCGLMVNGTKCQRERTARVKCKKITDQTKWKA
jgi:hypothetical protein